MDDSGGNLGSFSQLWGKSEIKVICREENIFLQTKEKSALVHNILLGKTIKIVAYSVIPGIL